MEKRLKLTALVSALSSEIGDPQWVERDTDHKVRLLVSLLLEHEFHRVLWALKPEVAKVRAHKLF